MTVVSSITAALAASPNPASIGQKVTFDASASTDVSGPITDYKWDLNGSGKYETDTGSTPTVTTSFASTGAHTVEREGVRRRRQHRHQDAHRERRHDRRQQLRGSDPRHAQPAALLPAGRSDRPDRQRSSRAPPTARSAKSSTGRRARSTATPTRPSTSPARATRARASVGSSGTIPINLSSQSAITVEFWLKWNTYGNDDALAMELTPNYNTNTGGFLVDPNAPQFGGTFGVGIGVGTTRNSVFFAAPERGRVAPLRVRARHDRAGGQRDHPLRRRPEGELPAGRHRHRRRAVRQLHAVPVLARRQLAVRQRLPATTWRSTAAISAKARSTNTSTPTAPTRARRPRSRPPRAPCARARRSPSTPPNRATAKARSPSTNGT